MSDEVENATPAQPDYRRDVAERNRSRVAVMLQGQPAPWRFVTLLLVRVADPLQTAQVLDEMQGVQGIDLEQTIADLGGRKLRHVVGRTRAQLVRDLGGEEAADKAIAAMQGAGLQLSEGMRVATPAETADAVVAGVSRLPHAPSEERAGTMRLGPAMQASEPTFGTDQFPASEIWDMPEHELAGIDGITSADIVTLRQLKEQNSQRIAGLPPSMPPAEPGAPPAVAGATATASPPASPPGSAGAVPANAGASFPAGTPGTPPARQTARGGGRKAAGGVSPTPTPAGTGQGGVSTESEGATGQ